MIIACAAHRQHTSLCFTTLFDVLIVKKRYRSLAVVKRKNPPPPKKKLTESLGCCRLLSIYSLIE